MKLVPDLGEARRFLDLFGEGMLHTFQVFPEIKKGGKAFPWHEHGDLDELAPRLAAANNSRSGVYFMVNEGDGKGRSEENVTEVRALFVDLDGSPLEPVLAAGVDPHAVVQSSPGRYQVFWLVSHCPLEQFRPLQLALAKKFGGDISVADIPRVMRVPGFYHQKGEPFKVTAQQLDQFLPYTLDKLVEAFNLSPEETSPHKQPLPALGVLLSQKIPEGERHNKMMRYAAKFAYEGKDPEETYALLQAINHVACVSPKPDAEIQKLVEAAYGYAGPRVYTSALTQKEGDEDDYGSAADLALPPCFVQGAPGLVGAIADWISSSTSRHQPHFSLAASLAFVGILKAHRVQTPRRSRTNHLTLAIGKSASGKSQAGEKIEDLIRAANLNHIAMGIPASDSALRGALSSRTGRTFLYWDEMGLALDGMLSKNAAFHYKAIKDLMIEVWTKASTILRRKELITELAQKAHVDIIQPCFGMYATAQPDVFYNALSSAHASDGFFPRLLVFETPNNYPPEREIPYAEPPANIVEVCRIIDEEWPTNCSAGKGNLEGTIINPRVVPLSSGAQKLIDAAKKDVQKKLEKMSDSSTSGVLGRSLEHMEKIALTVEDGAVISRESMEWSIDLVTRLSLTMAGAFKLRVSDSTVERTKKRVLQVIAAAGAKGLQSSMLTRKTQFLRDKRERDVVLSELESSGQVQVIQETTCGRTAKRWIVTPALKSNTVNPSFSFLQSSD